MKKTRVYIDNNTNIQYVNIKHELLYYEGTIVEIKNRIKQTVEEMKSSYDAKDIDKENGMYYIPLPLIEMFIDVYELMFPNLPQPRYKL